MLTIHSWVRRVLDQWQAQRRIRGILNSPGVETGYSDHAKLRMRERGVSAGEITRVLRCGAVVERPVWIPGPEHWKCDVEGPNASGRTLRVSVAFWEDRPKLVIITVIVR